MKELVKHGIELLSIYNQTEGSLSSESTPYN